MITIQELYQIVKQKYPDAKLEGMTLSAEGSLDLRSLKLLPKGVTLSAGRSLNLGSLTTPNQLYKG